jgi:hypothetical protein
MKNTRCVECSYSTENIDEKGLKESHSILQLQVRHEFVKELRFTKQSPQIAFEAVRYRLHSRRCPNDERIKQINDVIGTKGRQEVKGVDYEP